MPKIKKKHTTKENDTIVHEDRVKINIIKKYLLLSTQTHIDMFVRFLLFKSELDWTIKLSKVHSQPKSLHIALQKRHLHGCYPGPEYKC